MTRSSTSSPTSGLDCDARPGGKALVWSLRKAALSDITPIVEIVVEQALERRFNPQYLELRYQMGLTLQLCSTIALGRMRSGPGSGFTRAWLDVAQGEHGEVLGFALTRTPPSAQSHIQLYLLAVRAPARRAGIGLALLRQALDRRASGQSLLVVSLASATAMHRLLAKFDARAIELQHESRVHVAALKGHVIGQAVLTTRDVSPPAWR